MDSLGTWHPLPINEMQMNFTKLSKKSSLDLIGRKELILYGGFFP